MITNGVSGLNNQDINVYLREKKINHRVITPYHPQANGCEERLNRVLLSILRKLFSEDIASWPKHLLTALLIAHARVN